jgi:hypothetical protein
MNTHWIIIIEKKEINTGIHRGDRGENITGLIVEF